MAGFCAKEMRIPNKNRTTTNGMSHHNFLSHKKVNNSPIIPNLDFILSTISMNGSFFLSDGNEKNPFSALGEDKTQMKQVHLNKVHI
jgi:hypothetical protein